MTIRLSICIATYNRATFIGETLDSILPQLTDECELVIVDGASTDNTQEVVAGYLHKWPQINYVQLPAKGGIDKDYDLSIQHARGEYCWFFSDDDLIKQGAVEHILSELSNLHSLYIVNSEARSADLSELLQAHVCNVLHDKLYSPQERETLFHDTCLYLSFIGCLVIRRNLWIERERQRYYGTDFIHVGVIFQADLPGSAKYISNPWIIIRYGNASWSNRSFKIWNFQWPQLIWSFKDIPDDAKRRITRKEPWRNPFNWLIGRGLGKFSREIYQEQYAPLLKLRRERVLGTIISRMPCVMANGLACLAFGVFIKQDKLTLKTLTESQHYFRNILFAP
jgi:glycosyltransferase involved in cell wall biosynthesis